MMVGKTKQKPLETPVSMKVVHKSNTVSLEGLLKVSATVRGVRDTEFLQYFLLTPLFGLRRNGSRRKRVNYYK